MAKPRKIGVADCETNPFEHGAKIEPFIWGLYTEDDEYFEFDTVKEFVDFISNKKWVIYAHNGGKFDWHFLLEYINTFSPINVINGRLAKLHVGECELRDSWNILPFPLSAYQKDEIDYNIMRPEHRDKPKNRETIRKYLKADCVYLFELVYAFIEKYGRNLTIASAAMAQWRAISEIKPPRTNKSYFNEYKDFYFGGRVQAFAPGSHYGEITYIDINSAYPEAMLKQHAFGGEFLLKKFDGKITPQHFYEIKGPSIGILPYRAENNSLIFPNDGEIRYFNATGWEFELYSEHCSDFKVLAEHKPVSTINFDEYITKFYEEKENSEKGSKEYLFAKLFMNSLYGKFGANPENYNEYELIPTDCIQQHEENTEMEFASLLGPWALMQGELAAHKKVYYDVATAASITGYVRAKLYRAISAVEKSGEKVLYCDTDSVVITGDAPDEIELSTRLGAWSIEATVKEAHIAGKKLYALLTDFDKWITATKGAKLTPNEIKRACAGETVEWQSIAPTFSLKRGVFYQKRKIKKTA